MRIINALAVDVETAQFGSPDGGGVQGHEQSAVIEVPSRVNQPGHLFGAEHGRESLGAFRERNALGQIVPSQSFDEQETQGGHILADGRRSQLLHLEQMGLILPDLLGPELVGRLVKVLRELADDPDVGFYGTMGVITALEFFQHLLA
jgi:hypothetical protein